MGTNSYIKLFIPFCAVAPYCLVCAARTLHKTHGFEKADTILAADAKSRSEIERSRSVWIWRTLGNRDGISNDVADKLFPVRFGLVERLDKNLGRGE